MSSRELQSNRAIRWRRPLLSPSAPVGHAITLETDGNRNSAATPVELLLMGLGACTGSDVVSIMRKKRQKITSYRVQVRGRRREK